MKGVCAVLAAGRSSRMGVEKPALVLGGRSFLERALAAAGGRRTVLVVSAANAKSVDVQPHVVTVVNDAPERGMSHSLALANDALSPPSEPLAVLLVDTPLVGDALVTRVVDALGDADVAYPVRGERRGHPVVFGPRARARIAALPDGDTLRRLRDDPALARREVPVADDAPFVDVDTPAALAALHAAHGP